MSNRVATVLSIVAGLLLTAACLSYAAYEFYAPQWQIAIKGDHKGEHKGLDFGNVAGIRCDIKGMPALAGLKGEWRDSGFLKYGRFDFRGRDSAQTGNAGPGELTVFRTLDRSSGKLAEFCAQGGRLDELTIGAGRDDHKTNSSMSYRLRGVTISSITLHGPNGSGRMNDGGITAGQPYEEVVLSYGRIEWSYSPLTAVKVDYHK